MAVTTLVALLVCLIPTTIGGLLSAIGIAGMDRLVQFNVLAMSGRAVEAAGDVDTLLLDKTGTITFGNRLASQFIPVGGHGEAELTEAALRSSLADETPEGKSIVALAERQGVRVDRAFLAGAELDPLHRGDPDERRQVRRPPDHEGGRRLHPGHREDRPRRPGRRSPTAWRARAARRWRWSRDGEALGVIYLKDTVKPGMRERFDELRRMGIQDDHGHRRQPADRGHDRQRGGRRRLPGRGQARGQDRHSSAASRPRASWWR